MIVREPVLGIHDPAPPEGRVTIELLDERGLKVLKRERADNAILNHWTEAARKFVRGDSGIINMDRVGYNFAGLRALNTDTDVSYANGTDNWWRTAPSARNILGIPAFLTSNYHSLLLSASTEAVDADEWAFPGDITAFCYLPEAYAPSTNTKRAGLVIASSFRTPTAVRYQAEWGTAYGNGTINSIGLGDCIFPVGIGACFAQPSNYASNGFGFGTDASSAAGHGRFQASRGNPATARWGTNAISSTEGALASGHRVSDAEYWTFYSGLAANVINKIDLTGPATITPFYNDITAAAGIAVTGPSGTTIGAGTGKVGITALGADLWLGYATTLKRCAKPTNTTLSVTNTYAPVGVGTCIDLTTDGTSLYWLDATKVWVINATTGAVTTSWTHGLPGTLMNIAYMAKPTSKPRLYISYMNAAGFSGLWNNSGVPARSPAAMWAFTTAGVGEQSIGYCPATSVNSTAVINSGLIMPLTDDCKHHLGMTGWTIGLAGVPAQIYGPSHLSRTVLGAPIVKTSANGLRAVYEFGF